jgi:hypothetical protein
MTQQGRPGRAPHWLGSALVRHAGPALPWKSDAQSGKSTSDRFVILAIEGTKCTNKWIQGQIWQVAQDGPAAQESKDQKNY